MTLRDMQKNLPVRVFLNMTKTIETKEKTWGYNAPVEVMQIWLRRLLMHGKLHLRQCKFNKKYNLNLAFIDLE